MNVKLIFDKATYEVDVMKDSPCSYLYTVCHTVFRIPKEYITLFYNKKEIKNNSRLIFSVMGKTDLDEINKQETIIVKNIRPKIKDKFLEKQDESSTDDIKLPPIMSPSRDEIKLSKVKMEKEKRNLLKSIFKCQLCNTKNSIFYCRTCNMFICFECNVRYIEHRNHERINLEDGNSFLGCEVYREELINEINIIELGFKKSSEWIVANEDRELYLKSLFKTLEKIRANSQELANKSTLYLLDQETIYNFKDEVENIPKPRHREEVSEVFSNLNLKENELRNYTKFLNLQIIKTEYNRFLLKYLDKIKKLFDALNKEVKSKLEECDDIRFRGVEDIQLYLKNNEVQNCPNLNNSSQKKENKNNDNLLNSRKNIEKKKMLNLNLKNSNIFQSNIESIKKIDYSERQNKNKNRPVKLFDKKFKLNSEENIMVSSPKIIENYEDKKRFRKMEENIQQVRVKTENDISSPNKKKILLLSKQEGSAPELKIQEKNLLEENSENSEKENNNKKISQRRGSLFYSKYYFPKSSKKKNNKNIMLHRASAFLPLTKKNFFGFKDTDQ